MSRHFGRDETAPDFTIFLQACLGISACHQAISCFCPLWQYGLWNFQAGYKKLERLLPKDQNTQGKLLNFKNWFNGELSKIGHQCRK